DQAGTEETPHNTLHVNVDQTRPTIMAQRVTPANPEGWNNSDVVISYTASDGLSGLPGGTDTRSFTFTAEGTWQSHTFTVTDLAASSAWATVENVRIDRTPPQLAQLLNPPASTGWYNWSTGTAVVTYTASDDLSGVSTPAAYTFGEGANQTLAGITVTDVAGN